MRRPWDDVWLAVAREISTQSTCVRREVGCVLVDHRRRVLATGVNGVSPRDYHCDPNKSQFRDASDVRTCEGALTMPPGLTEKGSDTSMVACRATHAEANALLQCGDVWKIDTCYTTLSPCYECVKKLLCTSCRRIVFLEEYPSPRAKKAWVVDNQMLVYELAPQHRIYLDREWIKYGTNKGD